MSRLLGNSPGDQGSIPGRVIPKTQNMVRDAAILTLSTIRWGSRVKWSNPGMEERPLLYLGVVAIEKGAFGSPSTMVANLTY